MSGHESKPFEVLQNYLKLLLRNSGHFYSYHVSNAVLMP